MLSVRETLYYASELRMQSNTSKQEKRKRVEEIMQILGLSEHAETIVGNAKIRGISGGQTKRLSIGVEIISLPELIFMDEPTTG